MCMVGEMHVHRGAGFNREYDAADHCASFINASHGLRFQCSQGCRWRSARNTSDAASQLAGRAADLQTLVGAFSL